MPRRPRRNFEPSFKAKVALAAFSGTKTIEELASYYEVHPTQIVEWKKQLVAQASAAFGGVTHVSDQREEIKKLQAKVGEITMENDFLEHALVKAGLLCAKR